MIELKDNRLIISFPEVHKDAWAAIDFKRTLRIPDDGKEYPLPPDMGQFDLRHVEDYSSSTPQTWQKKGGVMMPMYQAEALWIKFTGRYPIALKVGTGKINAVSGEDWSNGLNTNSKNLVSNEGDTPKQGYIVIPKQPWIDGYCVPGGLVHQFVAMPLGLGITTEEQVNGTTHGGLQIEAFPLRAEKWEQILEERKRARSISTEKEMNFGMLCLSPMEMSIAAGGKMRQRIYEDPYSKEDWDLDHSSRSWVHVCNSLTWKDITNENPPHPPFSMNDYNKANLPWYEFYSDAPFVSGSEVLQNVKTVSKFESAIASIADGIKSLTRAS